MALRWKEKLNGKMGEPLARGQIVNLIVHGILVHPKETPLDATGL
jgi:hypothetical protein